LIAIRIDLWKELKNSIKENANPGSRTKMVKHKLGSCSKKDKLDSCSKIVK